MRHRSERLRPTRLKNLKKEAFLTNRILTALLALALGSVPLAAKAITLTNKTPGAELEIIVRNPMRVHDANAGGCKFTVKTTTYEIVTCPKIKTFQPAEHEIEIVGPNDAPCRLAFKDIENGWDARIYGPCRMTVTGRSSVTVTEPRP
jgi:hypothetical protein